jgi:hypothetical protein
MHSDPLEHAVMIFEKEAHVGSGDFRLAQYSDDKHPTWPGKEESQGGPCWHCGVFWKLWR